MGRHHVRILSESPEAELVGICDRDAAVAQALSDAHGVPVFDSVSRLADEVEAMVLAVPTVEHAELGVGLLKRGLHLLVEKPIASTLAEADVLLEAASSSILAVGHVEFFNPAVQALLALEQPTGFVEIHRLAAFKPRSLDIDVVLDLMIHDLQILHALDPSPIAEIRATGINVLTQKVDIANVRIELESGCVANVTASRISAEAIRKLRVFLTDSYYSLDYHEQTLQGVRLLGDSATRQLVPQLPEIHKAEPLKAELDAFLAACRGDARTVVTGDDGRRALATALQVIEQI